jgi:hypothetical protein
MAFFSPNQIGEKSRGLFLTFDHAFDEVIFNVLTNPTFNFDEVNKSDFQQSVIPQSVIRQSS